MRYLEMGVFEKVSQWIEKVFHRDAFSKMGYAELGSAVTQKSNAYGMPEPVRRDVVSASHPRSQRCTHPTRLTLTELAGDIDVARLRGRFGLTRTQFARRFGFPVATLRHWERGDRKPSGASLILLKVLEDEPRAVTQTLARLNAARHDRGMPVLEPRPWRRPVPFGQRREDEDG